MRDIFYKIPSPMNLIKDVANETELIEKLRSLYKNPSDGWKAYKLLSYIFATNRSTMRLLQPHE